MNNQATTHVTDTRTRDTANVHRLRMAARVLRAGGLVAHPTEGVWGLACNPLDDDALRRLLAAKRRDPAKGLILVADRPEALAPFTAHAPAAWQRACDHWPGPSTWLLPARTGLSRRLTGSHDLIALRVSAHPVAAGLSRAFGGAIVSTSANVSDHPAALNIWQARARLRRHVDMFLDGDLSHPGQPSTITNAVTGEVVRGAPKTPR